MSFLQFLQNLDPWVQGAVGFTVLVFAGFLASMLRAYGRATRELTRAANALAGFAAGTEERRRGRPLGAWEQVHEAGAKLGEWWSHIEAAVERYDSPEGDEGYFLVRPAAELPVVDEASGGISVAIYHAVPGILTSLGLIGTFVAILLGLNGLRMDATAGTVTGLDGLIANLSGKFVTSILALALGVVFLFVELRLCQPRLRAARARLVRTISAALPYLAPSRVLLDIHRQSVKQASALGNISADVVDKFANVFREDLAPAFAQGISATMAFQLQSEMGPTLLELQRTMRAVGETVSRLEESKQESVVGELRGLVESLGRSLQEALRDMGRQFHGALTGSTQEEFGKLAEVIGGSAGMVHEMNANFTLLQGALQSVVEEARTSTSAQMASGVEQTERMNSLVEGLMTRLNETASTNYQQISGTLTTVVADLSDRVARLSDELVETVGTAAARSQATVDDTLRRAGEWNAEAGARLETLLSRLERGSGDFEKAGQTLLAAQGTLQSTLEHNQRALAALGSAAGEVKAYTTALSGVQQQLREGQQAQAQVTTLSREAVGRLVDAAERHREFLAQYDATFQRYRGAFEELDGRVARVLETILDRVHDYNRSVEANFQAIVQSANTVMPQMTQVLKSSADSLAEQIEELGGVLETGTQRLAAATGT